MIQSVGIRGSVGSKFSLLGSGLSEGLGSGCSRRKSSALLEGLRTSPSLTPALKTTSVPGVLEPVLSPHPAHVQLYPGRPDLCSTPGWPWSGGNSYSLCPATTWLPQRRGSRWEVLPCILTASFRNTAGQSAFWPECIPKPRRSSFGLAQVFLSHPAVPY